jgi:hypothetical protein
VRIPLEVRHVAERGEAWRRVPWNGSYFVSDRGRVYSAPRHRRVGRLVRVTYDKDGYGRLALWGKNKREPWILSRLVLTVFKGQCPDGHEARHKDNDPGNNRLVNLSWATPLENDADKDAHGTRTVGERHPRARMTYGLAAAIRRLGAFKAATKTEIAEWLGISVYTVGCILRGTRWNPDKPLASGRAPRRSQGRTTRSVRK